MSEIKTYKCDIENGDHSEIIWRGKVPVMFDHDQEDAKSMTTPYFELKELDVCVSHRDEIIKNRKLIYAYGAMGYNKYTL